jgi:hypothetical protein
MQRRYRASGDAPACALWVFCQVDDIGKTLLKATTPALGPQVQGCSRCIGVRGRITGCLAGAHHCRFGRVGAQPDGAHRRGDSAPAETDGVIHLPQNSTYSWLPGISQSRRRES